MEEGKLFERLRARDDRSGVVRAGYGRSNDGITNVVENKLCW